MRGKALLLLLLGAALAVSLAAESQDLPRQVEIAVSSSAGLPSSSQVVVSLPRLDPCPDLSLRLRPRGAAGGCFAAIG